MFNLYYKYDKNILSNKNLLIHHHLGLGDHIVCAGLVNYIAENQNNDCLTYVLCKENNYKNVKKLFSHNTRIVVLSTCGLNEYEAAKKIIFEKKLSYLKIGHENYNSKYEILNGWDCGQVFYFLANIDYKNRFEKFSIEYDEELNKKCLNELNPTNEKYIFVHDDPSRGFNIDLKLNNKNLKIIKNDMKYNIFDYILLLKNAEEIHLMPSSFYCLIESIKNINATLYCYNIRDVNFGNINLHNWINIKL